MCLPAGMMELVRPESMRPQTSQRSVLGADTSAATRGVRERRQDGGETTSKTPQLPRDASVGFRDGRSPRAFLFSRGGRGHAQTQAARFGNWQAAAAFLPALFYRFRVPLSSRFFWRSGQFIGFAASQCVQSTHNLKAQPSFEDCCAKNKSGYLRIRATAVKERIEAVTNGQGRQGREDL